MGGQWLILLSLVLGVSSVTPSESIDRLSYYCKRTDLVNSHCVVNGLCVCSPDDFNADCRTNPRFAPEHVLPDEWELMLDSHDYQNLIQDTNPAWVVRDVDGDGGQVSYAYIQFLDTIHLFLLYCIFNAVPILELLGECRALWGERELKCILTHHAITVSV